MIHHTECVRELDKLNLVKLSYDGLILNSSWPLLPHSLQKWPKETQKSIISPCSLMGHSNNTCTWHFKGGGGWGWVFNQNFTCYFLTKFQRKSL
jgi:hypothetical protein